MVKNMSTENYTQQNSKIRRWVQKSAPSAVLIIAFVMLIVGIVSLATGSMVLSKLMIYAVLLSMLVCLTLGILNKFLITKEREIRA